MTEGDSERAGSEGKHSPPILDYRSPVEDPHISKFQVFAGICLSTLILMAAVFFGLLGSFVASSPWPVIVVGSSAIAGVVIWAVLARRSERYRGLAIGLWIGFGVTFLIEGLCFSNMQL
jgi:hypothetical protein